MKGKYSKIFKSKGQAMVEYIIVTTLVGIFCISAMKNYGGVLKKQVYSIKKQLNGIDN